jgi:carboxypeptidase Taq
MSYSALEEHQRRIFGLRHVEAISAWDEAAMMPPGGGAARAEALATLRGLIHELSTDPRLGEWIATAETNAGELTPWQLANLRESKRAYLRETCIPRRLVEASSRAESQSEQAWRVLRPNSDWASFRPLLETVVSLKREVAAALSARLGLDAYDALVDGYEPGAKSQRFAVLFGELRAFLPGFIDAVLERQGKERVLVPDGPFPVERQRWLGLELMKRVGFDFTHGRLDDSHHPFCGGVPTDVRITTRYDERDFQKSLMGVMHETGHAKYEQNLPRQWLEQPVGFARGMSVHESQSLFQEMQVCRSHAFLSLMAPLVREAFPGAVARQSEAFELTNLYRLATRVRRDYIRVDADEATYPCHVLVRFEIEKALIDGTLAVREIPEAWDQGMFSLLGLRTGDNHRDGCLQDVHWPAGLFGYFPTYTLGALTAAQLFRSMLEQDPGISQAVEQGDFTTMNAWLRDKVWSQGSLYDTDELIERATGAPLGTRAFREHLERRYLSS